MSHHYVNRCTFTVDDCSAQYKLIPPYSHRVWDGATHYVSGRVLLQSLRLRTCDGSDNRIHKGSTEPNPIRVTMVVLLFFLFFFTYAMHSRVLRSDPNSYSTGTRHPNTPVSYQHCELIATALQFASRPHATYMQQNDDSVVINDTCHMQARQLNTKYRYERIAVWRACERCAKGAHKKAKQLQYEFWQAHGHCQVAAEQ